MQDAEPTEKPSFKKLKQTKEDVSGVGKVSDRSLIACNRLCDRLRNRWNLHFTVEHRNDVKALFKRQWNPIMCSSHHGIPLPFEQHLGNKLALDISCG